MKKKRLDSIEIAIKIIELQLGFIKKTVADLREMAGVSTPAPDNGQLLTDEHIAKLLSKREKTRAKKRYR